MTLVGNKIDDDLLATAVVNGKDFHENYSLTDLQGKYVLLFFYPLDFTFVCPTELHAFQDLLAEFEKRNCQVLGCSVDSQFSHKAWLETPIEKGGIKGVKYPLIADINKDFAKSFGVLCDDGIALRGTFLIDREGVVRHSSVNDLPLGRNVDEYLRLLDALKFFEENGNVCPASWKKGEKGMKPTQEGLQDYFSE